MLNHFSLLRLHLFKLLEGVIGSCSVMCTAEIMQKTAETISFSFAAEIIAKFGNESANLR